MTPSLTAALARSVASGREVTVPVPGDLLDAVLEIAGEIDECDYHMSPELLASLSALLNAVNVRIDDSRLPLFDRARAAVASTLIP